MSNFVFDIYFNSASQMHLIFMWLSSQLSVAYCSQHSALLTSATTSSFLFFSSFLAAIKQHLLISQEMPVYSSPLPQYEMDRVF